MNLLSIIVFIFGIAYIYLSFIQKNDENFEGLLIKKCVTTDAIFDDFYVFLLDDLFYKEEFYTKFCRIILYYTNNVYNNHLCIGIKHGGHINELLKNNMKITTIANSTSIVDLCRYNYTDNKYNYVDNYETNSYIFNENEFTHISLIDNEIYYTKNLNGMIYNISKWISNRGYLFIDVYDNMNDLKNQLKNTNNGEFIKLNYKYSDEIKNISNNRFYFIENIKIKNEEKTNYHEMTFYSIDYIKSIALHAGLTFTKYYDNISSVKGRGVIVFQKV